MKRIIFTVAIIALRLALYSQSNDSTLCKVQKINGVEAYIMCTPLRDYTVLVDTTTGIKVESVATGGLVNKTIAGRVEQFITHVKKVNSNIDAVVYITGKRIIGIKFKDAGTEKTIGIGKASKVKGYPVFVMCEPLNPYQVVSSKGGGVKWKSAATAGLINNSIEEDVQKIVNKFESEKGISAFYFDGTKEGAAISFKK